MKIGFIGLGIMGKPMAMHLLQAGHELTVFDINPAARNEMRAHGAMDAASATGAAQGAEAVMTMLSNSPQVKEVVLGEHGVIHAMHKGSVLIDMSSISPLATREICAQLRATGVEMLDAPVSGGEPKAIDGSLAFMVGGRQEVFERYKSLLLEMGASVVRCGEIGAGNVTKLCNQIIVAANIAAVAEALMLGQKAGVAPDAIYQAIRGGLAGSAVLDAKAPMMMDRSFKPGFKIDLHIKDLNNVMETAQTIGAPSMITSQVLEMMRVLRHAGEGQSDHSALIQFYEKLTGEEVRR